MGRNNITRILRRGLSGRPPRNLGVTHPPLCPGHHVAFCYGRLLSRGSVTKLADSGTAEGEAAFLLLRRSGSDSYFRKLKPGIVLKVGLFLRLSGSTYEEDEFSVSFVAWTVRCSHFRDILQDAFVTLICSHVANLRTQKSCFLKTSRDFVLPKIALARPILQYIAILTPPRKRHINDTLSFSFVSS